METDEILKQVDQLVEQTNTDLQSAINVNTRIATNTTILLGNIIKSLVQEIKNRDSEITALKNKVSKLERGEDVPQTASPS
jgi:hypothetical protein